MYIDESGAWETRPRGLGGGLGRWGPFYILALCKRFFTRNLFGELLHCIQGL